MHHVQDEIPPHGIARHADPSLYPKRRVMLSARPVRDRQPALRARHTVDLLSSVTGGIVRAEKTTSCRKTPSRITPDKPEPRPYGIHNVWTT